MAGIFNIPQIRRGTTSKVQPFTYKDKNNDPINISSATLFVEFRKDCATGTVVKTISLGSGISFTTDGTDGKFQFDAFLLEWSAGRYFYDIKSVISGINDIYIKGERVVIQNVTQLP